MTRKEIENLLPYFCNYFEGNYRCELVLLSSMDTYHFTRVNMASIIKYDIEKYISDINLAVNDNEDLKNGVITLCQLEYSLKIKNSVLAESIEYLYQNNEEEFITNLFFHFLSRIGSLATSYAVILKSETK